MRTKFMILLMVVILAALSSGCATTTTDNVWKSEPIRQTADNPYLTAEISPLCSWGCPAFRLTIRNKTDKDLEVNWNKTLYIAQGQTSGGFMFEGIDYRDRNIPKPPDIIFGNGMFSRTIWPNNLVHFSSGRDGGWTHESMPRGENGVYLTVIVDGEQINEKLTVRLYTTPR